MAMQTSHTVMSLRSCSSFRKASSFSLIDFQRRSAIELSSLFYFTYGHIYPRSAFCSQSKRRSRGPVMAAKKDSKGTKQGDGKYKHTVDLPKTTFGMRANSAVREPEIQKLWDENQVFKKVAEKNTGGSFVLHDGPPYANGDLHMGHALNKIIKDIINRYKLLQNCKSLDQDARKGLTPLKLRAKAAKFAKATVKAQMASFKRFGVWADWDNPYLTLDPEYEAAQIEVFGQMVFKGYIYRGRKPVHWSPSSRTALAEAELEYPEGHVSKSMYAVFKLLNTPAKDGLLDEFLPKLSLAVWTTTPWTIPANAAVAVNPKLQYVIVEVLPVSSDIASSSEDKNRRFGNVLKADETPFFIVAADLVPTLEAKWNVKLVVKKTVLGSDLENYRYAHPINGQECPVVIGGDYITTESGTGLVHTAPGHGQDDYITGLKYGLPIISPVDDEGKFTEEAGIFSGLDVLGDGNAAVINHLDERLSIVMVEPYKHKYPYDWRTKKPTIFRATAQWFASVEGFREAAMDAINQVTWTPSQSTFIDFDMLTLYIRGASSFTRRSCQTVLAVHLLSISRVIAPILPHLAEDVWQNLPFEYNIGNADLAKFVFESKWPEANERWLAFPEEEIDFWGKILELRTEVNKALESARTGKLIGSSLEAKVYLHSADDKLAVRLRNMCEAKVDADSLHRIFITSQ
ncbi:hypothetical protein M8C21_003233, partial [Ambrosia artemisiifolia]